MQTIRRRLAVLGLAGVLVGALSGCDGPLAVGADGRFTDACSRTIEVHGINNVVKSAPYAPETGHFVPGGLSLSAVDVDFLRSLGLNGVRLGVMWAGVVPTARGAVNHTYLAGIANTTAILFAAGMRVLLDAHQDGLSERFCDDGAPLWWAEEFTAAAPGFPEPLLPPYVLPNGSRVPAPADCGKISSWFEYYLTSAVGVGFNALYTNSTAVQDFADFWSAVVAAHAAAADRGAGVLAYELLNEPWAGDAVADPALLVPGVADAALLQPFYARIVAALRAAERAAGSPAVPAAMEPVTWLNGFPSGFNASGAAAGSAAWEPGRARSVLSYHYYALPDIAGVQAQVAARAADARRLSAAALLTEFDVGLPSPVNPPYGVADLRATLDACEAAGHGWFGWAYGSLYQGDASGTTVYVPAVRELARPFAPALAGAAGNATFNATDASAPVWRLTYTHDADVAAKAPTLIFISTGLWWNASTLAVAVDSDPSGAVEWSIVHTPGAVALPAGGATRAPVAAPFAFATLTIASAAGATGRARVAVVVRSG